MPFRTLLLAVLIPLAQCGLGSCQWEVSYRNFLEMDSMNGQFSELSGITMLGSTGLGQGKFMAVADTGGAVVEFDASLDATGIVSATATNTWQLDDNTLDAEGLAFHPDSPNSVFIAYESDTAAAELIPGIREFDFDGLRLQSLPLPTVWATNGNVRNNRGFESLARSVAGDEMWTANEEALTIDGDAATASTGTIVRLQQFAMNGSTVNATAQFAYEVDPVHGSPADRSGLADLVALPDGTLLALEALGCHHFADHRESHLPD